MIARLALMPLINTETFSPTRCSHRFCCLQVLKLSAARCRSPWLIYRTQYQRCSRVEVNSDGVLLRAVSRSVSVEYLLQ